MKLVNASLIGVVAAAALDSPVCDSMHLYILNGIRCTRCPSLRVNLRRQGP